MNRRHHFSQTGVVDTASGKTILNAHVANVGRTYTADGWTMQMRGVINGATLTFSVPERDYSKVAEWLPKHLGPDSRFDPRYVEVVRESIADMSREDFKLTVKTGFYTDEGATYREGKLVAECAISNVRRESEGNGILLDVTRDGKTNPVRVTQSDLTGGFAAAKLGAKIHDVIDMTILINRSLGETGKKLY